MKLEDIPVEKRKSFESVYNSFLNTIKEIQKWTEKLSETLSKPLSIEEIIKNTDLKLRGILSSEEGGQIFTLIGYLPSYKKNLCLGHLLYEENNNKFIIKDVNTINNFLDYDRRIKGIGQLLVDLAFRKLGKGYGIFHIVNVLTDAKGFWEKVIKKYYKGGLIDYCFCIPTSSKYLNDYIVYENLVIKRSNLWEVDYINVDYDNILSLNDAIQVLNNVGEPPISLNDLFAYFKSKPKVSISTYPYSRNSYYLALLMPINENKFIKLADVDFLYIPEEKVLKIANIETINKYNNRVVKGTGFYTISLLLNQYEINKFVIKDVMRYAVGFWNKIIKYLIETGKFKSCHKIPPTKKFEKDCGIDIKSIILEN